METFLQLLSSSHSSDPPSGKIINYPYLHNLRPSVDAAFVVLERGLVNQVACIVENRVNEDDLIAAIEIYSKTLGDTIDDARLKIVGEYLECVTNKSHRRLRDLTFMIKPKKLKCLLEQFATM
jgi:hypothetical protein